MKGFKKVAAFALATAMTITVIPGCNNVPAESTDTNGNSISYQFAYKGPGLAYGKISITTEKAGDYQLYWGDEDGGDRRNNRRRVLRRPCRARAYLRQGRHIRCGAAGRNACRHGQKALGAVP